MEIIPVKTGVLLPPKDDLFSKITASKLALKEGDVVVVSSKVVSIDEGRTIKTGEADRESLAITEADYYLPRASAGKWRRLFTMRHGVFIGGAGIDESNGDGHYILWPKNPMGSAKRIRAFLQKTYKVKKLGVIIADSRSLLLRRGAVGFALGWAGVSPVFDYRGKPDLFGRPIHVSVANLIDPLASAAVFVMGECAEQTPIAVIRGAGRVFAPLSRRSRTEPFVVPLKDDVHQMFFRHLKWKKGGSGYPHHRTQRQK